jgi:hypothetical protein
MVAIQHRRNSTSTKRVKLEQFLKQFLQTDPSPEQVEDTIRALEYQGITVPKDLMARLRSAAQEPHHASAS